MAISTDHQEETRPPVPQKTEDAPPSYQPSDAPSTSAPSTHHTSHSHATTPSLSPTGGSSTYSHPPHIAQNGQSSRPPHPTTSSPGEISIPFYSNPPPPPDLPDHKPPIISDVRRPSNLRKDTEMDRMPSFACLTLHSNDKLGSTNLSAEITNDLDGVIRSKWAKGVKQWAHEDGGWCWQLQGKPWSHGDLATPARELLLALLTRLSNLGYSLHTSLLSSPGSDKDSLILRKTPMTIGAGRDFFAVCFYKSDKIKIIGCPDDSVKEAINTAIKVWPEGVQSTKDKGKKSNNNNNNNNHSWKLKGTPWKTKSGDGECVTSSRALLCAILEELENVRWELVGSVKMTKPDDNRDLDTWIFSNPVR